MPSKPPTDDQYTKPELREKIKAEVMAGDKGGKPGQWSARKAQLVAHEYEAQGGGYKHERTETQEHLHEWTAEHWQTADGKPAERKGGTTRYLPAAAWDKLSPAERNATNAKKASGSKHGQQFVANTPAASKARHDAELTPSKPTMPPEPASSPASPRNPLPRKRQRLPRKPPPPNQKSRSPRLRKHRQRTTNRTPDPASLAAQHSR